MSTLKQHPVKLIQNVSCFIFACLFPRRKVFCICLIVPQEQNLELTLVMLSIVYGNS